MARQVTLHYKLSWLVLLSGLACGQDPAFRDLDRDKNKTTVAGNGARSTDSTADDDDDIGNFGDGDGDGIIGDVVGDDPASGTNDPNGGGAGGGGTGGNNDGGTGSNNNGGNNGTIDPDDYIIPDVSDDDAGAIKRCIAKWGRVPFPQTITNVRKIVSVSVGGFGNPVNDTEATDQPQLVLIAVGVNVGGSPTYNLLNPNAYYCMNVNVNVLTNFTINLHCNARLSDSLVDVNVGSIMTGNTARIGVHVNSKVTINSVRPNGDECIR